MNEKTLKLIILLVVILSVVVSSLNGLYTFKMVFYGLSMFSLGIIGCRYFYHHIRNKNH